MTWTSKINASTNICTNSFTADTNVLTSKDQVPNASNYSETFAQVTIPPPQAQLTNVADFDVPSLVNSSKSTSLLAGNSTIMTHMGVLHVPAGCHVGSFTAFVDLSRNDTHCDRNDLKTGVVVLLQCL